MSAESTRQLWAASYTFTYLIKEFARRFDEIKPNREWLKPALGGIIRESFKSAQERTNLGILEEKEQNTPVLSNTGVGVFPDHLIVASKEEDDLKVMQKIVREVIEAYGEDVALSLGAKPEGRQEIVDFLKHYFQVYIIIQEVEADENPILNLTESLSAIELQPGFSIQHKNVLEKYFAERTPNLLTIDAFADETKTIRSIPDIALGEFLEDPRKVNDQTIKQYIGNRYADEDTILQRAREFVSVFNRENPQQAIQFYSGHKYIAIVQADGDGIGALLKSLPKPKWNDFSEGLAKFSIKAAYFVQHTYGGLPVYFGGDDALFFAPVISGRSNIFDLLRALDEMFRNEMSTAIGKDVNASLSFGLSITYAKFPLYEALKSALHLLLGPAKNGVKPIVEGKSNSNEQTVIKNNIAFSLLRHSGSAFSGVIHLDQNNEYGFLNEFLEVFKLNLLQPEQTLRSILYDLPANRQLYRLMASDSTALAQWLENSFDEKVHGEKRNYLAAVAKLINKVYKNWRSYPYEKKGDYETIAPNYMAYSLLKTIAFLTTPEFQNHYVEENV